MNGRGRIGVLIGIMGAISLFVGGTTIHLLYGASIDQQRMRLMETAQSRARILEAIARQETAEAARYPDVPGHGIADTLSQIVDAHEHFHGFGETGEFTLARREGSNIVFLLRHRDDNQECPKPIPFASELAEPMRRALLGQSGIVTGPDYRGEMVLAAHEPVAGLDWGIVAKIDLTEIRAPFVRAGIVSGCVGLLVVLCGAWLFLRVSNPILLRLEEGEARIRAVVETAADGIITISDRGIIESYNTAAERIFGYTAHEVIGQNVSVLMPSPEKERHDGYLAHFSRTGEKKIIGYGREVEGQRQDGSRFPMLLAVSEVRFADRRFFTGIVRDITQPKQAELELRIARAAAEAGSRAKSEFLANMSHEIRTPMTAILGFSDNLLDPSLTETERTEIVQIISSNGQSLLRIINDVLDISKIEAGQLDVERIRCSPSQLVTEVKSLMQIRADAKDLSLVAEFVGPVPATIESDPMRLKQILVNLIGNAIKFTETGEVKLIARFVAAAESDAKEPRMQFDVVDTGIGMSEDEIGRLFQPFYQADASGTRKFGGTGLGLSVSHRLSDLLGGEITVESKPGAGSLFRVAVPVGSLDGVRMLGDPTADGAAQPETATATNPNGQELGCRILMAEDGPDNQRLISFVLRKAGAEVTIVENGKLATDAALAARDAGAPFDLILMDMQMPVMDGYEATRLLRSEGYRGPIIALTAHAMAADRQKCIDAGCDNYATKPIDRPKLIETIRKSCENQDLPENEQASLATVFETTDVSSRRTPPSPPDLVA